jgi:hypothetical protein
MIRACIHELRPEECALCKSDDWHEGIARVNRRKLTDAGAQQKAERERRLYRDRRYRRWDRDQDGK